MGKLVLNNIISCLPTWGRKYYLNWKIKPTPNYVDQTGVEIERKQACTSDECDVKFEVC